MITAEPASPPTDRELLQKYSEDGADAAFAELVGRHTNFVYSACLRQVRDPHLAEDCTQAVFVLLARKAKHLHRETRLMGWLFNVARYASANALKRERRRRHHEQQAAREKPMQANSHSSEPAIAIDPALGKLSANDREAVLLRFFSGKSHKEVAASLGLTEAAVKMRIGRALEKLRTILTHDGQVLPAAGVEAMLIALAAAQIAAPVGLPAKIAKTATQSAVGRDSSSIEAIIQGANQMLMWMKYRFAAAVCLIIVVFAGAAFALVDAAPDSADKSSTESHAAVDAAPVTPATAPAVPSTPKEVVVAAFRAATSGDETALIAAFDTLTPQQETTLKRVTTVLAAADKLMQAVTQQFGPEAARPFQQLRMGVMTQDIEGADEVINGETAVVDMGKSGPGAVPLVKVGSTWKISSQVLASLNPRMVDQVSRMTPALTQVTQEINAGKYKTPQELQQGLARIMQPAATTQKSRQ